MIILWTNSEKKLRQFQNRHNNNNGVYFMCIYSAPSIETGTLLNLIALPLYSTERKGLLSVWMNKLRLWITVTKTKLHTDSSGARTEIQFLSNVQIMNGEGIGICPF